MPTYALLIEWSEWGRPGALIQQGTPRALAQQEEPFTAVDPKAALNQLRNKRPFLRGLPWHFAGKSYKLLRLDFQDVQVGEKFVMMTR